MRFRTNSSLNIDTGKALTAECLHQQLVWLLGSTNVRPCRVRKSFKVSEKSPNELTVKDLGGDTEMGTLSDVAPFDKLKKQCNKILFRTVSII